MSSYRFPRESRQVILDSLPEDTSLFGGIPELRYTYLPAGHAKALHPDSMLVVGIRGAGKSFWWAALQKEGHRSLVRKILPKAGITEGTVVSQGFGEKPSPDNYPSKDVLVKLLEDFDARQIWRTVILKHLTRQRGGGSPLAKQNNWKNRVTWVDGNPEEVERLIFDADTELDRSGIYHLILFDALDRTADDWNSMYRLVRGLLQVLLEFRSYKRIRPNAFVRPDHLEDSSVANFPDSSKVLTQEVELSWPRNELYGLLWQHLSNETNNGKLFRDGCREAFGIEWTQHDEVWIIPEKLWSEEETQRDVFHAITGPWMGRDRRRGFPYTWLPNHLGDTWRQVSPRSFLAAMRHAALDTSRSEHEYAIHFESIKRGVQEASKIRVREMLEDYPWVEGLMRPLAGLTVPCSFEDIAKRWENANSLKDLQQKIQKASVKLPPVHIDSGPSGVCKDLVALGLFEQLADDRVNLPDVYRVGYGLRRRGGVKVAARA